MSPQTTEGFHPTPGASSTQGARATLSALAGAVLRARTDEPFGLGEAVRIGERGLLGEVVQLRRGEIVVQVYEDTGGLRPGVRLRGTGSALSVPLGPGMLGRLFDGLLRPLPLGKATLEPGVRERSVHFSFRPTVAAHERLARFSCFGTVALYGRDHRLFLPSDLNEATVEWIAAESEQEESAVICRLREADGRLRELSMIEHWPVRRARPSIERLPSTRPLLTGQRVLDTLFPLVRGSRGSLPGGFGTGKTLLLETLAKWSDADVVVYVGCGERGNEMAGVLHSLPKLIDPRTGRSLLERTVIIANTSNMPVAAREASIYTGIAVAEYFRDQGLHVALMADSTSRWAEALREVSGRLFELPAEGGYPAYLSTRLSEFYERAGQVRTLSGEVGSVTLIGAISPPGGDLSEPVTKHTERYVRAVWSLDVTRARARLYPAIDPLLSYSDDVDAVAQWWESEANARWRQQRQRLLSLLGEQSHLERMARIVGKDALPPRQRLLLVCAMIANESFLRQSALSQIDASCSPARQSAMLNVLLRFIELAEVAVARGVAVESIESMPSLRRLRRMGEELGEQELSRFKELERELEEALIQLPVELDDVG